MAVRDIVSPLVRSQTVVHVSAIALGLGIYAAIPALLELSDWQHWNNMPSEFHGALSLILGCLLVFRTNTAHSRWWEARTLWGSLVNTSRNSAIKLTTLGAIDPEKLSQAHQLIVTFPKALMHHLRGEREEMPEELNSVAAGVSHVPQRVARLLYSIVSAAKAEGQIDGDEFRVLDTELRKLMDICGACERILKTRIVKSYRVFARQCVFLFLATLPWGISHDFRLWTIPLSIITAYFMVGLEIVAEHVEEPFGYDEDDLDIESLCNTIEVSVAEVFQQYQADGAY